MNRRRILTSTILVLVLVGGGFGLSACGEPVAYGPDVYGPDVYVDGWFGGWDHRHFDHGGWGPRFSHGHSGFAGHGGEGGHGGFAGHGGGGGGAGGGGGGRWELREATSRAGAAGGPPPLPCP